MLQILLLCFISFALWRTYHQFTKKILTPHQLFLWLILWSIMGTIVIKPDIASRIALLVGVGRGADLVLYSAVALLFYLVFHLMVTVDKIDQDITNLVSALALKDITHDKQ